MNKTIKPLSRQIFVLAFSLLMVYPVLWWLGASLKSNDEMSSPNIFSENPVWSNYIDGWFAVPNYSFTHFYLNTFTLIGGVLFTTIISCSLAAFAFARLDFPLRKFWFAILLVTLMLPGQVLTVPQYVLYNWFGWINRYLPFYVPHALGSGAGGSFFIFMLVQFMRGIPKELDDSARMDGCSWFRIYWHIMMPLTKPALVTVGIFCFLWNWDDFFGQLLYINSVDKYTINLALKLFMDTQSAMPWGQMLAMSLLSVVPAVIIFFFAQKHFVEGISAGALKG
ncbi:L-arabinose transport system permease protein AraQ [compost metagenome]